jgi:serine/threonine protein kinase
MDSFRGIEMHEKLGTGGFGEVYKAWHIRKEAYVAVKVEKLESCY